MALPALGSGVLHLVGFLALLVAVPDRPQRAGDGEVASVELALLPQAGAGLASGAAELTPEEDAAPPPQATSIVEAMPAPEAIPAPAEPEPYQPVAVTGAPSSPAVVPPPPAPAEAAAFPSPPPPIAAMPMPAQVASSPPGHPETAASPPPPPAPPRPQPQAAAPARPAPRPAAAPAPRAASALPAGARAAPGRASGAPIGPSAPGPAQAEAGPPLVTAPGFRRAPSPPVYPPRAIELDLTGTVLIRALLDPDGDPRETRIQRSSGHAMLDAAALAAVRRWAFMPASRDGRRIEAWVEVPVHFRLN